MNSLTTRADLLNGKMVSYSRGDFLLKLFTVAEEMGFVESEFTLENKLGLRLINYIIKRGEEVNFKDQMYIVIRNLMYIMELYLTSYEFKTSKLTLYDIVKIIDDDKAGITNLLHKAQGYIKSRSQKVTVKLGIAKSKVENMKVATEYFEIIDELNKANSKYIAYIKERELIYANPILYSPVVPMFIQKNVGFETIQQMTENVLKELEILNLFEYKFVNDLILTYLGRTEKTELQTNLFELVITNYIFATVCSDNPKTLVIDKVDAKIIYSEILAGRLDSSDMIRVAISGLENLLPCKEKYIKGMEEQIRKQIEVVKTRQTLGEEFVWSK